MPARDWADFLQAHHRPQLLVVDLGTPGKGPRGRLPSARWVTYGSLQTTADYAVCCEGRKSRLPSKVADARTLGELLAALRRRTRCEGWASNQFAIGLSTEDSAAAETSSVEGRIRRDIHTRSTGRRKSGCLLVSEPLKKCSLHKSSGVQLRFALVTPAALGCGTTRWERVLLGRPLRLLHARLSSTNTARGLGGWIAMTPNERSEEIDQAIRSLERELLVRPHAQAGRDVLGRCWLLCGRCTGAADRPGRMLH
jgi:hypothetical protein